MSTQLALPSQVPAHIVAMYKQRAADNAAAVGGITSGGFARIGIGGSKFFLQKEGESHLIADASNPDLPKMQLELIVVGFNSGISKVYYEGEYVEGSDSEPACSSDNGIIPDAHIAKKQSAACATCPKNQWGSKINNQGKQIKACSDTKRLAVVRTDDIGGDVMALIVKPSFLKEWANYVKTLDSKGIYISTVSTKVFFDSTVTFPKLLFKFDRFLTEAEIAQATEVGNSAETKTICSPRNSMAPVPSKDNGFESDPQPGETVSVFKAPTTPTNGSAGAPVSAPIQPSGWSAGLDSNIVQAIIACGGPTTPAGAALMAQFAPPAAATAPEPPKVVDPYAGLPAHVKLAVDAAGGLGTAPGDATFQALGGKLPAAATAPEPPPEPPKPSDPFEGYPAHVKLAVDAAGGLGTPAGDATFKALGGKLPEQAADTGKRRRRTKAEMEADRAREAVEAAAPKTPAIPQKAGLPDEAGLPAQAPTATFVGSAPTVAAGTSLSQQIEPLLKGAMATPTT